MQQRFKTVFDVYIEGEYFSVMNEQCNYVILDKLQLTPSSSPIVAISLISGLFTFDINAIGDRLNMARILLLYSGRSEHNT